MSRRAKSRQERCAHHQTVTVRAAGMERTVCEKCGHISFSFTADLTEEIERGRFSRHIDDLEKVEHQ